MGCREKMVLNDEGDVIAGGMRERGTRGLREMQLQG